MSLRILVVRGSALSMEFESGGPVFCQTERFEFAMVPDGEALPFVISYYWR